MLAAQLVLNSSGTRFGAGETSPPREPADPRSPAVEDPPDGPVRDPQEPPAPDAEPPVRDPDPAPDGDPPIREPSSVETA
jgi:hypothetical protein